MRKTNTSVLQLAEQATSPAKKAQQVTSYDVARLAGVSQSAVSRCFKPGASVSKKMRAQVIKAADKLGYQPNAIARSLITRRSNLVGVILSDFTNLHYPEVLFELNQGFSRHGVHVLLFTLHRERDIDEIIEQVFQYQVDGVVVASTFSLEQIDKFEQRSLPLVFFNRTIQDRPVSAVCCDQEAGERMLVNRLVNAGHTSFGVISGPEDSLVSVQRTAGARDRLIALGFDQAPIVQGDYTYGSGRAGVHALMRGLSGDLDAVICANDVMAIGCIDALREDFSLAVPDDISVVGFDGVAPAIWSGYNLTTIRQPVAQMSQAAVDMILDRVEEPDKSPEMRVFSGDMLPGGSARLS